MSLPAATAPAGLSQDGLPVGMQIVAPRFEEPLILRVARLVHQASGVGWPPATEISKQRGITHRAWIKDFVARQRSSPHRVRNILGHAIAE